MILLTKILPLLCLCGLGYSWQDVRNADQTLWAFRSCQHKPEDADLVPKWQKFEYPDDPRTHCYMQCVWIRLGAFSKESNSFRSDIIAKQFKTRGVEIPQEIQLFDGTTEGCKGVYDKTTKFFQTQLHNFQIAYYATIEGSNEWFAANPDTKPKGTKIAPFCEGKDNGGCQHSCSFYYYRMIDEDDLVVPFSDLPGFPEEKLQKCREEVAAGSGCKSGKMYECLEKADGAALEEALMQLNNWSERY